MHGTAGILAARFGGAPATAILLTVLGQSNAIAAGTAGDAPPSGYSATPTDTQIWVPGSSSFAAYQAGVNSDPKGEVGNAWGMELAFVQKLRDAGDTRPVYIHKWASGGQALNVNWQSGTGATWTAWDTQRTAVRTALDALHANRLEVVLWNQGEADARTVHAPSYEANYDDLIADFRARDADGASALWITQRIRPYTGDLTNFPLNSCYQVRAAQEKARSNVRVIDQDFESSGFATLHPGVSWVIEAGVRCYNAYSAGTQASDTTPSNLGTITDVTGATTGSTVTSNEIVIAGIDRSAVVTITGGEYRVRNSDDTEWQAWTSAAGTIHPFQKLTLRTTASGSPSTAVSATVTVGGVSEVWSVTTASATLTISGTPPSPVNVGSSYSFTPTVSGGVPAYSFSLAAGTLPAGLSLNTSTGAITGTPTTAGTASGLVLRVTDSASTTADLGPFDIVVNAVSGLATWDSTVNNPTGLPNIAYTNSDRTASTSANTSAIRTTRNPPAQGKTSGKWYARVNLSGAPTAGRSFGLILQAPPPGAGTLGTNRWSWGGTSIGSNSASRTMPRNITTVDGDYEIAVDLGANLFWMRLVGDTWNNSGTADPATGVDGLSCSARGANAIFLLCSLPNTTTLFSMTIVAGSPPSGFTEWG